MPHIAAGLLLAASAITFSSSVARADAATCTFNSQSAVLSDALGGQLVDVQCTGLAPNQAITINEESPLASIVQPSTAAVFESNPAATVGVSADSGGAAFAPFALPLTFVAADPQASCPPTQTQVDAGLVSCSLVVRDSATSAVVAAAHVLYLSQPTPQTAPSVSVTNGSSFAAGNTVTISGSGFWGAPPGSMPVVAFGLTPAIPVAGSPVVTTPTTYVCDSDCNGTSGTLTVGGSVSGSVVVPSGLVAGPTALSVLQTTTSGPPSTDPVASLGASTPVLILGSATAAATPNLGEPGTVVQVTGTGWNPQGGAASLAFLSPSTGGGGTSVGSALIDGNGNLTGTITVTGEDAVGVNPIVVTQDSTSAQALFTVTASSSQCVGAACSSDQVVTQSVGQGDLSILQTTATISLSPIVLSGVVQHSTGALNPITVVDDRGILVGWTVTGTLAGDFANANPIGSPLNNTIPASNLQWTPSVALAAPDSGVLDQITVGDAHTLSKTEGTTLCAAPTGGGGGSFTCGAALDLTVPASIALGTYTVVLNITVT